MKKLALAVATLLLGITAFAMVEFPLAPAKAPCAASSARARLLPEFFAAEIDYPPAAVTIVHIRDTHSIDLFARSADGPWKAIGGYPFPAGTSLPDGVHDLRAVTLEHCAPMATLRIHASGAGVGYRDTWSLRPSAAADLASLAEGAGAEHIRLIVSPTDYRAGTGEDGSPSLRAELTALPVPVPTQPRALTGAPKSTRSKRSAATVSPS